LDLYYCASGSDPSDGRARIIRYTDRGWRLYRTGSRSSHDIGRRWARAIGQRRYDQFESTLRAIVDLNDGSRNSPP
jgi:DNA-binding MarR family transcriptional regulator